MPWMKRGVHQQAVGRGSASGYLAVGQRAVDQKFLAGDGEMGVRHLGYSPDRTEAMEVASTAKLL
jgi:hypothetical protein